LDCQTFFAIPSIIQTQKCNAGNNRDIRKRNGAAAAKTRPKEIQKFQVTDAYPTSCKFIRF
jgi:hypothetical protein